MRHKDYIEIKAISPQYLDSYPDHELLEIVKNQSIHTENICGHQGNWYNEATAYDNPYLLVGKKKDEVLERLREEKAIALEMQNELTSQVEELKKDYQKLSETVDSQNIKLARKDETVVRIQKEKSDIDARLKLMENDIAKLRTALGDIRMNEILNSDGQPT